MVALVLQVYGLYAPEVPGPSGPPGSDKVAHLLGFGVPAALAWLLRARWVVVLLVVHALISEPLQGWLQASRQADVWDLVADLTGIALGVGLAALLLRVLRRRRT